jgi:hypothetical protein
MEILQLLQIVLMDLLDFLDRLRVQNVLQAFTPMKANVVLNAMPTLMQLLEHLHARHVQLILNQKRDPSAQQIV